MDFKLSELQQDIANLAKDFAEKKLAPTVKDRDEKEVFDRAILDETGTLGLLGIPWEEENGGVGADFLSLVVACEEVAKVDPSIALSFEVHTMLCSWPIWKFGTAEQKAKFLKPLAEGTKLGAFGLTEPNAGTDALNGSTSAVKNEDGSYTLTGITRNGQPLRDDDTVAVTCLATASQMAPLLSGENGAFPCLDTPVKQAWREALSGGGVVLAEPEHYMTLR